MFLLTSFLRIWWHIKTNETIYSIFHALFSSLTPWYCSDIKKRNWRIDHLGIKRRFTWHKILFAWNTYLWDKVFVIFHVLHVKKQNTTINKTIFRCTTISNVCSSSFLWQITIAGERILCPEVVWKRNLALNLTCVCIDSRFSQKKCLIYPLFMYWEAGHGIL